MSTLSPNIRFADGKCREGMEFYKSVFGGKTTFMTVAETPMAGEMDASKQNLVMHAELSKGDMDIFGSDMMRDPVTVGDQISLCYTAKNEKEIRDIFAKLSDGGDVFMPVEPAFWGGLFGMVTDRYGVEWMLTLPEKKSAKKASKKPAKNSKGSKNKKSKR